MANELTYRFWMAFAKDGCSLELDSLQQRVDVSATKYQRGRQTIGTTAENLILGDVSTPAGGWFFGRNLSPSYDITIKPSSSGAALVVIKPGESVAFRFASTVTVPQAQAITGAADLDYAIIEA